MKGNRGQTLGQGSGLILTPGNALRGDIGGEGRLNLPGDKSLSHRAALFAAMAQGDSQIKNFQVSGVTQAMLNALTSLGILWTLDGTTLCVQGKGLDGWRPSGTPVIDCGNSATTLRLLAGALAAWGAFASLDGSPGLRRRPMRRIVEPLRQMGVMIESNDGCAPLVLRSSHTSLRSIEYTMPVASAQVKSCLLLAGLSAEGVTTLIEPGPSRDHTERMLRAMGVSVLSKRVDRQHKVQQATRSAMYVTQLIPPSPVTLAPLEMTLPSDISAAAFLIVAALIVPGSEITLRNVGLNPTRTGLLDALQGMGADLDVSNLAERNGEPSGDLTIRHSSLQGIQIRGKLVVRMIDEFPIFAIAAALAQGETNVSDASELRHKESDRISALSQELRKLGVKITEMPDGFSIQGGHPLRGGSVDPHGDHRLAMAMAVAGLVAQEGVIIQDGGIVSESFPDFAHILRALGADVKSENGRRGA